MPKDLPRGSLRGLIVSGAALVGAAMLLVGEAILFGHFGFREHLLHYDLVAHDHPNPGETLLFVMQAVFGVPAALLICRAGLVLWPAGGPTTIERLAERAERTRLSAALVAALLIVLIRMLVFRGAPFTDDERTYVYEARALLAGGLTTQAPGPLAIFSHQFLLERPDGRWAGVYPVGQPLLLAFGRLLGASSLTQVVCGGGIVYLSSRLAERLWNAKVAVWTALLLATSPFVLCVSATLHNSVPATFFMLVVLTFAWSVRESGGLGSYALVGAGLAALQLTRQLEALLTGLSVALLVLPRIVFSRDRRRHAIGLGIVLTCCVASVFVQLASNEAVTGNPLVSPYTAFARPWPGAKLFGFGPAGWGAVATFPGAVAKTLAVLMRLSAWGFGWPGSLAPFLLALLGVGASRAARACIGLVLAHATAYFFLTAGAVHDIGSVYHLFDWPGITMVTAVVLVELGGRLAPLGETARVLPTRLVFAASLVAALSFWPQQLSRLAYVAETINGPVEAAEAFARSGPILLFWDRVQPPGPFTSWVYFPPPPGPTLDDPVLWVRAGPLDRQIAASHPERKACRLQWDDEGRPSVVSF